MGQIVPRGRIWWIRYFRNGKRHDESSHSTKKGVARDLLRRREGAIADGVPVTAKIYRFSFEDASADLITEYKVNKRRSLDGDARDSVGSSTTTRAPHDRATRLGENIRSSEGTERSIESWD